MPQVPPTQIPLNGVKACLFDAYGTLFDLASAARACTKSPRDAVDKLTALWRDKQLQYTWLRAAQDRHADFCQVTADALDFALETLVIERAGLREELMHLYLTLDAFPEVSGVLAELKAAGLRTPILSNGTPGMLEATVNGAKLGGLIDTILSVEEVGVYKPHPKVYQLAVDRLSLPASEIAFQSSNSWDAYSAAAFGMQVVWRRLTTFRWPNKLGPRQRPQQPLRAAHFLKPPALLGDIYCKRTQVALLPVRSPWPR